jgi:uncharacterized protein
VTVEPSVQTERVVVVVADDGMSACARIITGEVIGADDVDAALASAAVCFGIDADARAALVEHLGDPMFADYQVDLARGVRPVTGEDAQFEPTFHVGIQPGHMESDGTIDFYDRELTKPAARQQLIGWLRPPTPGTDGRDVRDQVVAARAGQPQSLRLDSGVIADADGAVRATVDGVIVYVENTSLDVVSHFVHAGDVDLKSGSLETEGSLTIRGDVLGAFSVRAAGDIVVQGSVDGGTLIAEGNIHVRGDIRGGAEHAVSAQGGVTGRHAERATVTCGGAILLQSATHCELSGQRVEVSHTIRGGRAAAATSVTASEAGAPRGSVSTTLAAAVVLDASLRDAKRTFLAAKERRRLERQAGKGLRGDGARSKGGKLSLSTAAQQREELERRVQIARTRAELLHTAFVQVRGTAYSGVMIALGEHRLVLDRDVSGVRFSFDPEPRTIVLGPPR